MGYNFTAIEKKWQQYWLENKTFAALDPQDAVGMRKAYILDMFPYPSGAGLHVGHPEGYTATDIVSRYLRAQGYNVLHPMGWDAFGLPAEQYAIKNGVHPADTTAANIQNFRKQIQMLGLSYDWDREVDTTDPAYYRWTQWIFLQLFNSFFDPIENKAKPIGHLIAELQNENYVVAPDGSIHINPTSSGLEEVTGEIRVERKWRELTESEQRDAIDGQRLAYMDEAPVNWCPALGTVLSNEEVIDGKSEVGGFPVERRPLRQWMLRITAYADRLISDLDGLEWPESLKEMQRNWIGKSIGAEVDFDVAPKDLTVDDDLSITVFTTRPDTLYGATYMVLAPEHELVDKITPISHIEKVAAYRAEIAGKSDRDRMSETKDKTGAFTGAYAINPMNDEKIPIYIADYVLMGYGTGAIMAVPAHDDRDFEFAKKFGLPIRAVVKPTDAWLKERLALMMARTPAGIHLTTVNPDGSKTSTSVSSLDELNLSTAQREQFEQSLKAAPEAVAKQLSLKIDKLYEMYIADAGEFGAPFVGEGIAINSPIIDGMPTAQAKEAIISDLEVEGVAYRTVKYKLRDWLFSRQRYWGEPFPIVLDSDGNAYDISETELPLTLPQMVDFKPTGTPEPPLSKMADWLKYERDGKTFTRETNTMPQWAGSCWYYLRYIDPKNKERFVDPDKEKYWMPVDLYVGGVEHAVLHLLYARFWHKVLFDLGQVSTPEPFGRLVNQGLILGEMEYHVFADSTGKNISVSELKEIDEEATSDGTHAIARHRKTGEQVIGRRVDEDQVEKSGDGYVLKSDPTIRVDARSFKMSKSRGNVVNPDVIVRDYGADTFRLYEMYLGPLEQQKPWNTRDIVGMSRFLASVHRNLIGEEGGTSRIAIAPIPDNLDRMMHRTIKKVADDIVALRFNTAIAELIKLNNELIHVPIIPRDLAENFTLMLAPFAPHLAEELWLHLGHHKSLARRPWPVYDESKLVESTIEIPVQVNGKLRDLIKVDATATEADVLAKAAAAEKVVPWLAGKTIKKQLYVPKKLVNFVV
jgi:leucyl-tRNA synthetase